MRLYSSGLLNSMVPELGTIVHRASSMNSHLPRKSLRNYPCSDYVMP